MEKANWNSIHIRKKITDYKCEQHKNPCAKNAGLCSTIILNFPEKHTQQKITMVSTPSPSSGGIFIAFWISQTNLWE